MQSFKIIIILISLYGVASTITFITYIIKYNKIKKECQIKNNNLRIQNISNYDIYYDSDFYNKFDLIDDYKDKIIIYSKDINYCYSECNNIPNCFGFTKLHNYCYLKGEYNISQKNNATNTVLALKQITPKKI